MAAFDAPNINVEKKSNEQNMLTVKNYLSDLADTLNYTFNSLQGQISALEEQIEELKG
jgi:tRNA(Phe) wybutosine-synthesizing methylase Tyw3